jgi:crotonobetainyl-CoA:carnitine CoA-transferase CaiB-like acyl-CoA transferase
MNRTAVAYQCATGNDPRDSEKHMWGAKHRIYRTADDRLVFMGLIEQKFWERFCLLLDRPDLVSRWESDGQVDYGGGPELEAELQSIFATRTAKEWGDLFAHEGLPGSPLLTLAEVMDSSHFQTRGMLQADLGRPVPNVAGPVRWLDRPGDRPGRDPEPAADVGADTDAVLASWIHA